jgi:hypothetical protein
MLQSQQLNVSGSCSLVILGARATDLGVSCDLREDLTTLCRLKVGGPASGGWHKQLHAYLHKHINATRQLCAATRQCCADLRWQLPACCMLAFDGSCQRVLLQLFFAVSHNAGGRSSFERMDVTNTLAAVSEPAALPSHYGLDVLPASTAALNRAAFACWCSR